METLLPLITAIALLHFGRLYFPAVVSEKVAQGLNQIVKRTEHLPLTKGVGSVAIWVIIPALIFMLFLFWINRFAGNVVHFVLSVLVLMWILSAYHTPAKKTPSKTQQLSEIINELSTWFWCIILGPAGALATLLIFYFVNDVELDEAHQRVFKQAERLWHWIPARIIALSFALSGHFVKTFSLWRGLFLDKTLSTQSVVEPCLMAAVGEQSGPKELQECIGRTRMVWLAALVLMLFSNTL